MRFLPLLAACVIVAASRPAAAQSCAYFPDSKPNTGTPSAIPFGATNANDKQVANHRMQFIVPKGVLGTQARKIRAIGLAPVSSGVRSIAWLEISLRHIVESTLNTDTLFNGTGGWVSTRLNPAEWVVQGDAWNRLPLEFDYDPQRGNLLVDIYVYKGAFTGTGDPGFRSDPSIASIHSAGFDFQAPRVLNATKGAPKIEICYEAAVEAVFLDSSCTGSNNKSPRLDMTGSAALGQSLTLSVSDGPAGTGVAILFWSTRRVGWSLAGNCTLIPFLDFINPAVTQNGAGSLRLPIPNDKNLLSFPSLYFQWWTYDPPANALQFVGSNWAWAQIGP